MENRIKRVDGRPDNVLRKVRISCNTLSYAAGSVLFELGNTKVLCAVTLQQGVPPFLRGKKTGWLNAEYAMLPTATLVRTPREITQQKRSGRSVELSRFIGRVFRTIADLSVIGEATINIDCDVLQADGGTRVAAITGSYLALALAQDKWLQDGVIATSFLTDSLAAVSVGMINQQPILDPDYLEDTAMHADFNFVMTGSGLLIEIHGGAERAPIAWSIFDYARQLAQKGITELLELVDKEVKKNTMIVVQPAKSSLFSLKERLGSL